MSWLGNSNGSMSPLAQRALYTGAIDTGAIRKIFTWGAELFNRRTEATGKTIEPELLAMRRGSSTKHSGKSPEPTTAATTGSSAGSPRWSPRTGDPEYGPSWTNTAREQRLVRRQHSRPPHGLPHIRGLLPHRQPARRTLI